MSWLDHYHKNTQAPSDATKVSPSSQQVDYQYASKVPFGTTNPAVPTYYKKQANAQFTNQGQPSVIKKTDTSKQHTAQKLLNKVEFGNNDLANTVLDFTAKFPIQSGINLMNPQIRNDEDVARVGMDLLGALPIIGEAANLGVKGSKFGRLLYGYGNKAYKDAKVISDAEKLNNSLTPAYKKIKDIPEKIRRIGNIWNQPTMSYSEELDKLNRLKKLNVEEQHLKGITGLDKKQIDDRINHLSTINSYRFDQSIQTYIDHHISLNENRIRYGNLSSPPEEINLEELFHGGDAQTVLRGNDFNLDPYLNPGTINLERPTRRARLVNPNLYANLSTDPSVPSWIKNTIDKHFNKGLISKINPDDAVVSTNPSLYRGSQNVDEALKETQRMINISPSGTKIRGANSLSDSSFPLVVSNIRRNYLNKNLKDVQFGGYNHLNFSGYLEKANIHPDVVVPYLNTHIDELSKTLGKKIPKAYYNDQGIFYPDLVGVKMQDGGKVFLQPNNPKLKQGYNVPSKYPSTELATSIGGEKGEPAYLIPSFKQGHLLNNPVKEFNNTGEYLGGPFKTWQEADKWEKEVRHPYVEKGQSLPSPLKWWGDKYQSGGSINQNYQTASQVINNTGTLPVFLTRPTPVVIPKHPMLKNITKMQPKWLDTYDVKTEGELQTPDQGFGKYMGSDGVWRADYTLPTHLKQGNNWRNTMIQKHKKGGRVLGLYEMMGMPIPFKSGGLIKGVGGALYGTLEGGLDAMSMGLTDQITDAGANAIGGKDKTFNASRGAGNIAGAVGMDALTMGATHAGTVQQVAKGTNGLVQNTNIFGSNDKKNIGMGIDIFRATAPLMGGIEEGNVTSGQIFNSIQGTSQALQNNNMQKKYAEGGQVDKAIINVEKGELEVNPNTLAVVKEFRNKPKHPANGIDEQGNTMATVDNIIIPVRTKGLGGQQSLSKEYKNASDLRKKAIINNLKFAQARREGIKYEYGGKIKKYDGSNGSVVGPRADGGFYGFNDQGMSINYGTNNLINNPAITWANNLTPKQPYSLSYDPASRQGTDPNGNGVSINPMASASYKVPGSEFKSSSQPVDWNKAANIGEKALEYSPAIYNMARGLFDKPLSLNENDYLVKDRVDAPVLTGDAGRRDLLRGYNLGKYNNRQLGGTQAGMNNLFNTYADATSKFNENLENTNKVAKFEASKYNIENKFRNSQTKLGIKQFNEQNKAEKRNQVSKALTQGSDILQNERNNKIISNNLPNFLKYYDYNDKDGTFSLKTKTGGTK